MQKVKAYIEYIPGFALAVVIAAIAKWIEGLMPIHLIGASVIALFIGMMINHFKKPSKLLAGGLKFTSKKVLKFAIILLGASLSIGTILEVGKMSLTVIKILLAKSKTISLKLSLQLKQQQLLLITIGKNYKAKLSKIH